MKTHFRILAAIILAASFPLLQSCNAGNSGNHDDHDHDNEHMEDNNHMHEDEEMPHEEMQDHENMDGMQGDMNGENSQAIPSPEVLENVDPMLRQKIGNLTRPYLALKDALVQSDVEEAGTQAVMLHEKVMALHMGGLPENQSAMLDKHLDVIENNADKIEGADDLEVQRKAFEPLTNSVYTLAKAFNASDQKLYYQYCPMAFNNKGASWISGQKEIRNPYFGDQMLKCGAIKDELDAR